MANASWRFEKVCCNQKNAAPKFESKLPLYLDRKLTFECRNVLLRPRHLSDLVETCPIVVEYSGCRLSQGYVGSRRVKLTVILGQPPLNHKSTSSSLSARNPTFEHPTVLPRPQNVSRFGRVFPFAGDLRQRGLSQGDFPRIRGVPPFNLNLISWSLSTPKPPFERPALLPRPQSSSISVRAT